ncbi:MAG TPA: TetR family transcriptional regulator [Candidatus Pelethocola excrementipullorum]|nr:TetR family transcriptional regulator [Candidatus Pelethocola excrementipullorum]
MRTTPEETQRNKELIIETAIKVFSEKGFDATNMQDIADAAGISRGPLYYHFDCKLTLFNESVKEYAAKELQAYRRIFNQDKNILELIREDLYYCSRNIRIDIETPTLVVPEKEELKEAFQTIESYRKSVYDIKVASVKNAIEKGELKSDTDPNHIVNLMFVFYEGLFTMTQKINYITTVEEANKSIESLLTLIKLQYCI